MILLKRTIGQILFSSCAMLVMVMMIASANPVKANEDDEEVIKYISLLGEAIERVRENYVDEVSDKTLIEAAIRGMLINLDPHSTYLSEEDFEDLRTNSSGEFGGLGIEVSLDADTGAVKVVSPIDDTPASKAGLQANDLITHIDGALVQGMSLKEAVDLMRGPVGEPITLSIFRGGQDSFDVEIVRDRIQIQSVKARLEGDIGYIRISQFNGQAEDGIEDAMDFFDEEMGLDNIKGYVIDLRNNPGGLLDQAISVSDMFLDRGEIVSTRGRNESMMERYQARRGDVTDGKPIVVLINGGSASASEILAGALQDHHRAVIMGTKSFGKGSVQRMIPLSQGGAAIKLTTQHYYTPSGRSIQALGITPDIHVPLATLEVIENNRQIQESNLRGALENPNQEKEGDHENQEADDANNISDYQLERALGVIKGIAILNSKN